MSATFRVHQSFVLSARSLYVFAGQVVQGDVRPGMKIRIAISEGLEMEMPVEGVEALRQDGGELVALTVALEDPDDADFLQQLDVVGESLVVSDGA
ncbi:hypothetical protein G8A07_23315 [Roseateles sp. DAIF2]|uniref:hypothetical protein n=1 Tax=Roseateles sp. DAIF2 TaxID=2714952 RepID=UPI0018A2A5E5|nr:hypothetical protein [Roseateles sp. DAIF2]QPF75556.1 hypothetical protein G8A07_23315 [Roseateles sp. DAIF2]